METIDVPQWFQNSLDEMDNRRARLMKQLHFAQVVDDALGAFPDLTPSAMPYDGDITVSVWVKDMARVVEMIRHFRAAGFKMESHNDDTDNKCRFYYIRRDDGARICILARVDGGEGARCQYVQVGTKTVPQMELRCEGEAVA